MAGTVPHGVCVDGGDNELVDVVTPLLDCRG
jgi:hypothetical protein